jgi:hypothetical protein
MAVMAPMTVVMVLAGWFFILKSVGQGARPEKKIHSSADLKLFLWEIMPILIVVLVIAAVAGVTGLLALAGVKVKLPGALSILPGLSVSFLWVALANHIPLRQLAGAVFDKNILPLLFLVAAIMIFQGIMKDSRAVIDIRNELLAFRIPVLLVIMIMPFLSGLITGIAIGFVGTSFPLVIPLFPAAPLFDFLSQAALAYVFGLMGMMLSPVHLCFLVTKDYFKANLSGSYRLIVKPVLSLLITALAFFLFSRVIF